MNGWYGIAIIALLSAYALRLDEPFVAWAKALVGRLFK